MSSATASNVVKKPLNNEGCFMANVTQCQFQSLTCDHITSIQPYGCKYMLCIEMCHKLAIHNTQYTHTILSADTMCSHLDLSETDTHILDYVHHMCAMCLILSVCL